MEELESKVNGCEMAVIEREKYKEWFAQIERMSN